MNLRRWKACIPLNIDEKLYLSVFLNHDGSLNKYSLDINKEYDSHYEFYDEKRIRKLIYVKEDENKYLHEILTRYVYKDLLNILKPYIIHEYHF